MAGLMIGRTPEYLGKKIGVTEIKYIMMYTLASPDRRTLFLHALRCRDAGGPGQPND